MQRGRLVADTLVLTGSSMTTRIIGLMFQIYLTNRIGATGIGLYFLTMSVGMFAATFAVSGVRLAAIRLVSEELGRGSGGGAKAAVRKCAVYAVCFGTAASLLLLFGADFIGSRLIGDERTILSLRFLSLNLPFLSLGAVFSGYFTAVRRVGKLALTQVCEQVVRIAVTILALTAVEPDDVEHSCAAIVIGSAAGEFAGFLLSFVMYLADKNHLPRAGRGNREITLRLCKIALPVAVSSYVRSALFSVCNLLVPRGLRAYGTAPEGALADYGMIQGMVFPIITFPAALFISLSELLVPELTDAQIKGNKDRIKFLVNRILKSCLIFSAAVAVALLLFSEELGLILYKSSEVGKYVRAFVLLTPLMYLDNVTDGMLRGLGEHMYCMRVSIADAALSVILLWSLLPRFGIAGYIFAVYLTEAFNFLLSLSRLYRVSHSNDCRHGTGKTLKTSRYYYD